MFLRSHQRRKNGKSHRYFSVVESRRLANGQSAQRQVLYLGEINDTQEAAWLAAGLTTAPWTSFWTATLR